MRKSVTFGRQPTLPKSHFQPSLSPEPDDLSSERDILLTRAQYNSWKQVEKAHKSLKTRFQVLEKEKIETEQRLSEMIKRVNGLEDRLRLDKGHIEELTFRNGKLEAELRESQGLLSSKGRKSPGKGRDYDDLRAENERLKEEISRIQEETSREYEMALDRMREQTRLIRDRLQFVENSGRNAEDFQGKIQLLEAEKSMLNEHIQTLQLTLTEQCNVIEQLKGIISSLTESPTSTRILDSAPASNYSSPVVKPRDIVREIEALDGEIEALQSSLAKVLA